MKNHFTKTNSTSALAIFMLFTTVSCSNVQRENIDSPSDLDTIPLVYDSIPTENPITEISIEDKSYEGQASYYNDKYHGQNTASGEKYDKTDFTAAIKMNDIPIDFGTIVEVYNVVENKKVLVEVNDQMGENSPSFIDLSRAAAEKIGLIDAGRADVIVRILGQDSSALADYELAHERPENTNPIITLAAGDYDPMFLSEDSLVMEEVYSDMLAPISSLKTNDPKAYWFIVSWLNTAYKTPNWNGYDNYDSWRKKTLTAGVDCSGFTRVMCDRVFGTQVSGGSQYILDNKCTSADRENLVKGDLVFFRAPYSETDKIVHVGVYLYDGLFVHATSTRSAQAGRGLMINSLDEENWGKEYVTGGKIN